jgi:hypothetical protein
MGGWFSANVTTNTERTNSNETGYGTRTPNVSQQYTDAFEGYRGSMDPAGYNATQQGAVDYTSGYLGGGGAAGRVAPVNDALAGIRTNLDRYATAQPNLLGAAPRATAGTAVAGTGTAGTATAGRADAYTIDPVGDVTAQQVRATRGLDYSQGYMDPYLNQVVDTSLNEYDLNAGEARNALRASSAGAFGNKRTGVAEGQFASDAAIGRGRLASDLRSNAFRFATDAGMRDSDRFLTGDIANQDANLRAATTNAGNQLTARTFNAGAQNTASLANANNDTSVSQTNANNQTTTSNANANNLTSASVANANNLTSTSLGNASNQTTRDLADLSSRNTADALAVNALAEQAGITDTIANNIFTADGIDLNAAENLFSAGTISQGQLQTIIDAAAQYNGSSYTNNANRTGSTFGIGTEVGFLA